MSATRLYQFAVDSATFRALSLGLQHAVVASVELGIEVSDQLVFRERLDPVGERPGVVTGAWLCRQCKHELRGGQGTGILPGFAVLSLNNASENEWASSRLKRRLSLAERRGLSPERFWAFEEAEEQARRGKRNQWAALPERQAK